MLKNNSLKDCILIFFLKPCEEREKEEEWNWFQESLIVVFRLRLAVGIFNWFWH